MVRNCKMSYRSYRENFSYGSNAFQKVYYSVSLVTRNLFLLFEIRSNKYRRTRRLSFSNFACAICFFDSRYARLPGKHFRLVVEKFRRDMLQLCPRASQKSDVPSAVLPRAILGMKVKILPQREFARCCSQERCVGNNPEYRSYQME